jgi:Protein of unknown function (DUF2934)
MAEKKDAKQQQPVAGTPRPTEDEIRLRAYAIYCARDGNPGSEVDDWLKAETELNEGRPTTG